MIVAIKNSALLQSSEGHLKGDAMLECRGRMILAELAIESQDWDAACEHIFRVEALRLCFSGGSLLFNSPADRAFLWMRYGCTMLRNGEFKNAMFFFRMSDSDRDGRRLKGDGLEDVSNPEEFMKCAVERTRRCLGHLLKPPRLLITVAEYYELDDLMQELVIKKLCERFPTYDLDEKKVSELLKRKYSLDDDKDQRFVKLPAKEDYELKTALLSLAGLTVDDDEEGAPDDSLLDLSMIEKQLPGTEETLIKLAVEVCLWASEVTTDIDHPEGDC